MISSQTLKRINMSDDYCAVVWEDWYCESCNKITSTEEIFVKSTLQTVTWKCLVCGCISASRDFLIGYARSISSDPSRQYPADPSHHGTETD